jgi:vacuolar-type H+-ATPase subunit C/Vma6
MTTFEDLVARARGLSGRLLDREARRSLAQTADLRELSAALDKAGFLVSAPTAAVTPGLLEKAVRRRAAADMAIMAHRCASRAPLLQIVFEDEDRRSLRSLVRGAVQGAPGEERLAGLISTPALPERALEELARAESPAQVAALLSVWRSPFGRVINREARRPHPDLFRLEAALHRTYLERALLAAHGAELQAYVAGLVDLENARAAVLLATQGHDVEPSEVFVRGGRTLRRLDFLRVAEASNAEEALVGLSSAFSATAWGRVFERQAVDPRSFEETTLTCQIREVRRRARRDPLGPVAIVLYGLRLRAEALELRRIIWGIALGVPRSELMAGILDV